MPNRLLLSAVLALAMLKPAGIDAQRRARPAPLAAPTPARLAAIERNLLASSDGTFLMAARRNFPAEYDALIGRLAAIAIAYERNPSMRSHTTAAEMLGFLHSLGPYIANAPTDRLLSVARLRAEVYAAAQRRDVALCARMAVEGVSSDDALPAELFRIAAASNIAIVDAAGAGRRTPVAARGGLSPADQARASAAFAELDPRGDLRALHDSEAGLAGGGPDQQCRYALIPYLAIGRLPAELGGRVMAVLLTRELQAPLASRPAN